MGINDAFFRHLLEERLRLESNGLPTYQEGLGMNFIIRCNGNANEVMRLARDVLLKVNYQYDLYTKSKWDDVEAWKKILPIQFINGFKKVKSRFDIFGFFVEKERTIGLLITGYFLWIL